MKKVLIASLISVMAVSAFAAPKPKTKIPTTIKCAVIGESVKVADATKSHMYADYKGKRYFFCCGGCPAAFKKDPAKYAKKAESIPTPKATK